MSSILGTGVHAYLGETNWWIVLMLVPGAWVGGKLGAYIASRMTGNALLWVLRVTFVLMAAQLIYEGLTA
ncbi:Sulfite exporter TauE/SafE [compost metagenome]